VYYHLKDNNVSVHGHFFYIQDDRIPNF
jgi:hypothetical protein